MFMQRLLMTLLLIPLVLLAIYYANYWFFAAILLLLLMGCGFEWLQLIPLKDFKLKILSLTILALSFGLCYFIYDYCLIFGLFIWLTIILAIISFPYSQFVWGRPWLVASLALLLLPLFAQSMIKVFELPMGRMLIVYLLFLVWGADIGAYLAGKFFGQHKLIPAVSPGKTMEGFLGGLILALLVASVGYYYFQLGSTVWWFMQALSVMLISLVGDLLISMLKRRIHIKDTGHLIPGHGGVLDRLDSLIAAAPLFYCWFLVSGQ